MVRPRPSPTKFRRILGIDYGSERVGLSLSDPLGIFASPLGTVRNNAEIWAELRTIVERENVKLIVIGMPLNLKGEKSHKALAVDQFITRLKDETQLEVVTWDERFTTVMARQTLLDMGTKKKERRTNKGRVDSMAAAIILQGFLDSTKHSRVC